MHEKSIVEMLDSMILYAVLMKMHREIVLFY